MRLLDKRDLHITNGYLLDDDNNILLPFPHGIIEKINELEYRKQRANHKTNSKLGRTRDAFRFVSVCNQTAPMQWNKQRDNLDDLLQDYQDLLDFAGKKHIVCDLAEHVPPMIDTLVLGNPLVWSRASITDILIELYVQEGGE